MDSFEHKILVTKPFDLTYSYYLSPGFHEKGKDDTPTLIFTHGFPDDAYMWEHAMSTLLRLPYRIILAEILGLGDTDKPTEVEKYNYKYQANSLIQILDKEGVKSNVIPIGHDWGSQTAQRLYLFHKERMSGLIMLSLAYVPPTTEEFDLEKVNAATEKEYSYRQWEYWHFFTAPDAPQILHDNLFRFLEVNNGLLISDKDGEKGRNIWMREMFCKPGAMRNYLTSSGEYKDYTVPLHSYAQDEKFQKRFMERLGKGGLAGAVNYYHGLKDNSMLEEERPLATNKDAMTISHPCLYIGMTDDWVCRTDQMVHAKNAGLVPDLKEIAVDASHWSMYDKKIATEVAEHISDWLQKKFPVKS